jgi:CHAT domain-containing protein
MIPPRAIAATSLIVLTALGLGTTALLADEDVDAPAWLIERTRTLIEATPAGPEAASYPDTLLALAEELTGYGLTRHAALAIEKAGIHAMRQSDLDRAVAIWTDGVGYARVHGERRRESGLLNALAVGYSVTDRTDEAIATYGASLELKTELGDTVGVSRTWSNLATTYQDLGRVAEALTAMEMAENWNILTGNSAVRARLLINRAGLLLELGRPHESLAAIDSALAIAPTDIHGDELGVALTKRAQCRFAIGEFDAALDDIAEAVRVLETAGERYYGHFARIWQIDMLRSRGRGDEARAALTALQRGFDEEEVARMRIAGLLMEGLLTLDDGQPEQAVSILSEARDAFEQRRDDQDDAVNRAGLFQGSGGDIYGALALAHLAAADTLAAWRSVERGQAMLFRERVTGSADIASLADVQQVLAAADAVLIQACETHAEPLVWFVVTPTTLAAVEVGRPDPIAADARAVLSLLSAGEPLASARATLDRLGHSLIGPLEPWLASGQARRLYVVPPARLAGVPLTALPIPSTGVRLGERMTINHVPGATALVALDGAIPAATGMLAMGDPQLATREVLARADASPLPHDPRRRAAATPLPEARREVRAVTPSSARVLLGPEARLSTFLAEAGDQAVLHLATHALNDPLDGRRSTLLLASDSPADGPASLTAAACETLSLQADLAVLSACRSGLGHAVLGEGSFGLPRSLLVAGTRSVVSSLWDVEDRAARRFMEEFYAGLRAGRARDIALRDAAATLAASGAPPRDWAAFVLTGVGHDPVSAVAGADVAGWNRLEIWFGLGAAVVLVGVVLLTRLRRRRHA